MEPQRLRPHPYLLRRGVGSILAFFVPALGVFYFLTIPDGPWTLVLFGNLIVVAMFLFSLYRYSRLGVWVTPESITERGFFGTTPKYTPTEIGSVMLVNMYHGGSAETVPQLFVSDRDGNQLIRLRGQFWPLSAMQAIMATLEVPLAELERPVSKSEMRAMYPGLLYWFERRPVLAALLFASVLVVSGALIYLILLIAGVTLH